MTWSSIFRERIGLNNCDLVDDKYTNEKWIQTFLSYSKLQRWNKRKKWNESWLINELLKRVYVHWMNNIVRLDLFRGFFFVWPSSSITLRETNFGTQTLKLKMRSKDRLLFVNFFIESNVVLELVIYGERRIMTWVDESVRYAVFLSEKTKQAWTHRRQMLVGHPYLR